MHTNYNDIDFSFHKLEVISAHSFPHVMNESPRTGS